MLTVTSTINPNHIKSDKGATTPRLPVLLQHLFIEKVSLYQS